MALFYYHCTKEESPSSLVLSCEVVIADEMATVGQFDNVL